MKRAFAAAEAALVVPAVFFFIALFLRNFVPANDPANGPQQVVMWYAGRHWTLWILLVGLPLAALMLGSLTLLRSWRENAALRQDARRVIATLRVEIRASSV